MKQVDLVLEIIGQAKERNYTVLTTEKDFFRINETYKKNIKHIKITVEMENKNQFCYH